MSTAKKMDLARLEDLKALFFDSRWLKESEGQELLDEIDRSWEEIGKLTNVAVERDAMKGQRDAAIASERAALVERERLANILCAVLPVALRVVESGGDAADVIELGGVLVGLDKHPCVDAAKRPVLTTAEQDNVVAAIPLQARITRDGKRVARPAPLTEAEARAWATFRPLVERVAAGEWTGTVLGAIQDAWRARGTILSEARPARREPDRQETLTGLEEPLGDEPTAADWAAYSSNREVCAPIPEMSTTNGVDALSVDFIGIEKAAAVVVCAVNRRGETCIVWNRQRVGYEWPGGKLKEGETILDAARRELKEETGLTFEDAENMDHIGRGVWLVTVRTEGKPRPNDPSGRITCAGWVNARNITINFPGDTLSNVPSRAKLYAWAELQLKRETAS